MKRDCEQFLASLPEGTYDGANSVEINSVDVDPIEHDLFELDSSQVAHLRSCDDCQQHLAAVRRHAKLLSDLSDDLSDDLSNLSNLSNDQASMSGSPEELSSPEFLKAIYARARKDSGTERHESLFESLKRPLPPEELSSPEFFAGILDRAARGAEDRVSAALTEGITPVRLPQKLEAAVLGDGPAEGSEGHWSDRLVVEEPAQAGMLRTLKPLTTPGWLWSRIRSDVRAIREERLSERRLANRFSRQAKFAQVTAAAALITVSALLYTNFKSDSGSHENLRSQIKFISMNRSLDSTPSDIVAGIVVAGVRAGNVQTPGAPRLDPQIPDAGLGNSSSGGIRRGD